MSPIITRMVMMEYLEEVILPSLEAMISSTVLTRAESHLSLSQSHMSTSHLPPVSPAEYQSSGTR